ncbi:hypothetical protein ASC90_13435 [Rhizobium sp. Root1220]|nr:hypothetical protein ASC90_13435 [Rhizobium sp. Root1220]
MAWLSGADRATKPVRNNTERLSFIAIADIRIGKPIEIKFFHRRDPKRRQFFRLHNSLVASA